MPIELKLTLTRGPQLYIKLYKENLKGLLFLNRLRKFDQTQQECSMGGPPPKLFNGSDWLHK